MQASWARCANPIHSTPNQGTGGTSFVRCTQRPCTNAANCTAPVSLSSATGFVTAGRIPPDGGTYFLANATGGASPSLTVGFESGNTYAQRTLVDCSGAAFVGGLPSAVASATGRLRTVFAATDGGTRFVFEPP